MTQNFKDTLAGVLGKKKRKRSGIYRSVKDGDLVNPIPLDEFLEGVGGMLRMPPKEKVAPAPNGGTFTFNFKAGWLKIAVPVLGVVVAAVMLNRPEKDVAVTPLPPQLFGLWTTGDPRYTNRSFEIAEGFIAFKNGDRRDEQTLHPITGVRTESRADTTVIRIDYLDADATYHLAMKYIPRPKPAIIFTNQEELVWRRAIVTPAGSK